MPDAFITYQQFESLFSPLNPPYEEKTKLVDKYLGFSVLRAYPPNIEFKPAVYPDGRTDSFAITYVLVDPEFDGINGRVPVRMRITLFSKYLSNHFDYDFTDKNSPSEESVRLSKASNKPHEVQSVGKYFVDVPTMTLVDENGNAVRGHSILEEIFSRHVGTTRPLSREQIGEKYDSIAGRSLSVIARVTRFLLINGFGRELVPDKQMRYLFNGYKPSDVRVISTGSLTIFGYTVPNRIATWYCILVAVVFAAIHYFELSPSYLSRIANNVVLATAHGVLLLVVLNEWIPSLLRLALNAALVRGSRRHKFNVAPHLPDDHHHS